MPRPLSRTVSQLSGSSVTSMKLAWPATASSIALSRSLGRQVVQRRLVGAADIHAGPAAHRLQPLQDLDVLGGVVVGAALATEQVVHAVFSASRPHPSRRQGVRATLTIACNAVIEYNSSMATLTIRNIDAAVKERLRVRAAHHGQSMEAELRAILSAALGWTRITVGPIWPRRSGGVSRRWAGLNWTPSAGADRRTAHLRSMIVLDTNVISELMRPQPHPGVLAWVAAQPRARLIPPTSTRRRSCTALQRCRTDGGAPAWRTSPPMPCSPRSLPALDILPFGAAATARYPDVVVLGRRRAGIPIEGFDALVAATALAAGAAIATRDVGGFAGGRPDVD